MKRCNESATNLGSRLKFFIAQILKSKHNARLKKTTGCLDYANLYARKS